MTFEELVKKVAAKHNTKEKPVPNVLVNNILRDALALASEAALKPGLGRAPIFPGIGRFVKVAVRSTGRKPDGTVWTKPGRVKLGLAASKHSGGMAHGGGQVTKHADSVAA